jgi:hypothetical protein
MASTATRPGWIGRLAGSSFWASWRLPAALLAAGFLIRFGRALGMLDVSAQHEAFNMAVSFARTGVLGDSFAPGQGPTAHVLPITPLWAGYVYRWLGVQSFAAELVLATAAIACVIGSLLFLYRAFGLIGTPRPARLAALAFLALVPLQFTLEIREFRIWEGALAVCLAHAGLWALLRLERAAQISWPAITGMGVLAATLFFTSPPMGLGLYLCCAWLLLEKCPPRQWPGAALVAAVALGLFVVPWAVRNNRALGAPVWLRPNFGLELALAYHPGAVTDDPGKAFYERWRAVHPFASRLTVARMQAAGGEVAYARALGDETRAWISAHPAQAAMLTLRHARDYLLPPPYVWRYEKDRRVALAWSAVHSIIGALGFAGMVVALVAGWRRYRLPALLMVATALPYFLVQPVIRYRYLIAGLLVMFAADLVARVVRRLAPGVQAAPRAGTAR